MHRKLIMTFAASALAAMSLPAAAADNRPLSYTYVEAGYAQTQIDGLDQILDSDHLNGYGVTVSYGHDNGLILFGSYGSNSKNASYSDPDISIRGDLDVDNYRFGLGYAFGINERTDWVTKVAYESTTLGVKVSADYLDDFGDPATGTLSGEVDVNGYSLETGIRARLGSRLDGYIGAGYLRADDPTVGNIHIDEEAFEGGTVDLDEFGVDRSETFGALGLQFNIAGSWSLVGRATVASDVNTYFLGVRSSLY